MEDFNCIRSHIPGGGLRAWGVKQKTRHIEGGQGGRKEIKMYRHECSQSQMQDNNNTDTGIRTRAIGK